MPRKFQLATLEPAALEGDLRPLLRQLGSGWSLVAVEVGADCLATSEPETREDLLRLVQSHQTHVLVSHELPAIVRACQHATRHETRELIDLDGQIAAQSLPPLFAETSRRIGQARLRALRPLRDHRVVQRYLRAVEAGQANGWHTVVYGLTLAVYALPLLQGLIAYERQSLMGFMYAAARPLALTEQDCQRLLESLPPGVTQCLAKLKCDATALWPDRKS